MSAEYFLPVASIAVSKSALSCSNVILSIQKQIHQLEYYYE